MRMVNVKSGCAQASGQVPLRAKEKFCGWLRVRA